MRVAFAMMTAATVLSCCAVSPGQYLASRPQTLAPNSATAAGPVQAQPAPTVSQILQPALDNVQETLGSVHVDKWKKGGIRDEATQNIGQITRDLEQNLPPLLKDADSAPSSVSKMLPVSRNVSALYDVLLRVVEASRVVAPDEQVAALQQALVKLGNARLALGERMQNSADAMEKQVADLRAASQNQGLARAVIQVPVVLPCATSPARRTTKKSTRPQSKPSATPSSTSTNATPKPGSGNQQSSH
jgi:hypothetical protein